MSYQALARKWRPKNFNDLVGQQHVSKALTHALDNDRLHHAFLFTGTRGVGKTTIARILAKSLNCETGVTSQPCGECDVCLEVNEGRFVDLIEVDAASRTRVDETRDLLENVQYAPTRGRYKVYLIDEVHMFSNHSFNALLKTLEEPPPHVKFLLATTDPQKLPVTILSRCLQFNLKRMTPEQVKNRLEYILSQENIPFELPALMLLARAADGSMRDGLSILDQAIAFGGGEIKMEAVQRLLGTIGHEVIFQILDALIHLDGAAVINKIQEIAEFTPDYPGILKEICAVLHYASIAQMIPALPEDCPYDVESIQQVSQQLSAQDLQLYYQIAILGLRDIVLAPDLRMGLEMSLLRMLAFKPAAMMLDQPMETVKPVSSSFAVTPNKPVSSAQPVRQPVTSKQPFQPATNWIEIVRKLSLKGGLAKELANNCTMLSFENETIHLQLSPAHDQIRTPGTEEKLRNALSDYFQKTIKLKFDLVQVLADTPAKKNEKDLQNRQKEAETSIHQDQHVLAMKEKFNAKILEKSIKPVDE